MKKSILFSICFIPFCILAPIGISSCQKVEAQTLIEPYSDDPEWVVDVIGGVPYMSSFSGMQPMVQAENIHALYSYFISLSDSSGIEPEIEEMDWSDSTFIVVEYKGKFYYQFYEVRQVSVGTLISESEFSIHRCNGEHELMSEKWQVNLNNISQPLRNELTGRVLEGYIKKLEYPGLFQVCFGYVNSKGEEVWYTSHIIKT